MKLDNILRKIGSKKILVIGDVMIDEYFFGNSSRISPEAPVPILLKKKEKCVLGGAANVAVNLETAGQKVSMATIIGKDDYGQKLKKMFKEYNISTDFVLEDKDWITTVKTRFIGQNNSQMFRIDNERKGVFTDELNQKFEKLIQDNIEQFDLVVISDYNKGVLNKINTARFIEIANKAKKRVVIDIKEPSYEKYKNAYLLKPNIEELKSITQMSVNTDEELYEAAKLLKQKTHCKYVLVTRGKDGMTLVDSHSYKNFECASREVFDVTGAGDTVISYLSVGLSNQISLLDSIEIANYAAGVKVSKMGTYAVKIKEIIDYIDDENNVNLHDKIVTLPELLNILKYNKGKKIAFTNGCFDIFHVGHARYLKQASTYADLLIVGVNSDASVKRLKGEKRPIVGENERMELLSSLEYVSYVVLFDEDTPYRLIQSIQPDFLIKGADYKKEDVVGRDIVEAKGGKVILCPLEKGKSTTNIINKIIKNYR